MSKVLIIGCGGVASVAIHKCCQVPEVFTDICIASRTKSKAISWPQSLPPRPPPTSPPHRWMPTMWTRSSPSSRAISPTS